MTRFFYLLITFLLGISSVSAQRHLPEGRDSQNRDSIHFSDIRKVERDNYMQVVNRKTRIPIRDGRYYLVRSNGRSLDFQIEGGHASGLWEYYWGTRLDETVNYVDGYKHGAEINYSQCDTCMLNYVRYYDMGKATGTHYSFWDNGTLSTKKSYDDDGKAVGEYMSYHQDGSVDTKGYYKNGYRSGDWYYYRYDGTLKRHNSHRENKQSVRISYYPNGNMDIYEETSSGVYIEYKRFAENGDSIFYHNYVDGLERGYQMHRYRRHSDYNYIARYTCNDKGQKHGKYTQQYQDNLFLCATGQYVDGILDGVWEFRDIDGRLYRRETYNMGVLEASSNYQIMSYMDDWEEIRDTYKDIPKSNTNPEINRREPAFFLFSE